MNSSPEIKDSENKAVSTSLTENEELIDFEKSNEASGSVQKDLLGALLSFLRNGKQMSLLMICRQIEKIDVSEGVAELYSEKCDLFELVNNENYKQILGEFFRSKNLSYKIKEKQKKLDPFAELKEMFSEKLIIKSF